MRYLSICFPIILAIGFISQPAFAELSKEIEAVKECAKKESVSEETCATVMLTLEMKKARAEETSRPQHKSKLVQFFYDQTKCRLGKAESSAVLTDNTSAEALAETKLACSRVAEETAKKGISIGFYKIDGGECAFWGEFVSSEREVKQKCESIKL